MSNREVAEYYDQTFHLYKMFWHKDKSYADHYGYWYSKTKNLNEALINENKFMAEKLKIKNGSKILDAGCGIGGSSLWLVQNFDVHVYGITISPRQLAKAKSLVKEYDLKDKLEFDLQDYLHTKFPDRYFDAVWGCESVCYAKDKKDFLREAYRVLKPGGKIVVADGFLLREPIGREKKDYKDFCDGFALDNMAIFGDFKGFMEEVGFKNIKSWDNTKAAKPSSKIMYRRTILTYPLAKFLNKFGVVSDVVLGNSQAGISQYRLVKTGAAGHGVFYGEK